MPTVEACIPSSLCWPGSMLKGKDFKALLESAQRLTVSGCTKRLLHFYMKESSTAWKLKESNGTFYLERLEAFPGHETKDMLQARLDFHMKQVDDLRLALGLPPLRFVAREKLEESEALNEVPLTDDPPKIVSVELPTLSPSSLLGALLEENEREQEQNAD